MVFSHLFYLSLSQVIINDTIKYKYHTGRKEMFYLMMHSTHFIYGYMASEYGKEPFSERGNL